MDREFTMTFGEHRAAGVTPGAGITQFPNVETPHGEGWYLESWKVVASNQSRNEFYFLWSREKPENK